MYMLTMYSRYMFLDITYAIDTWYIKLILDTYKRYMKLILDHINRYMKLILDHINRYIKLMLDTSMLHMNALVWYSCM